MLPNRFKPKYQILTKLTPDYGVFLHDKSFNKKKWKLFKEINKTQISKVVTYYTRFISDQPVYSRLFLKTNIIERLQIKYLYKQPLYYKIKRIAKRNKHKTWINYIKIIEQTSLSFLYRLKLVNSYNEILLHQRNKHIFISGNSTRTSIKAGDYLCFSAIFKKLIRRRIIINYSSYNDELLEPITKEIEIEKQEIEKQNKGKQVVSEQSNNKYYFGIQTCVDFEPNSFRFFFIQEIKYFKNHPFQIPFESIYQWYSFQI